jgi:hypothetical protein
LGKVGRDIFDDFVKSQNSIEFAIPAKAGIQLFQDVLDPGLRRGDDPKDFSRNHHFCILGMKKEVRTSRRRCQGFCGLG